MSNPKHCTINQAGAYMDLLHSHGLTVLMTVNVPVCLARAWAHAATTSILPQHFLLPSVQEKGMDFVVAAWIHATIVTVNMADAASHVRIFVSSGL